MLLQNLEQSMLLMKNTLKLKSKQMEFTTKDQELIKECKTTSLS